MIDSREVSYQADGRTMRGHLAWPTKPGRRAAVLIGHEGIGLNDFQRARADRLAERGYVAFAMDYLAGGWYPDPADMMNELGSLMADPDRLREMGHAALRVILDQPQVAPSRVAALGYGAGGTIALELGRSGTELAAIATVNPVLPTSHPKQWAKVTCPLLVCVGSEDPLAPPATLTAFTEHMRSAHTDWQLIIYGGAQHAFHLPPLNQDGTLADADEHENPTPGVAYHPASGARAWRAILGHLDDALCDARHSDQAAEPAHPWHPQ